ncbi:hypothetical protein 015DV002_87 [Bacillus phage 015DV002]|nr:hypothetical protein 015DV002_87 [Bacillus phage 015DV002]
MKNKGGLNMEYTFEKMLDGDYQVRLNGEFVCYSNHRDAEGIDKGLKEMGFNSREEFFAHRVKSYSKDTF